MNHDFMSNDATGNTQYTKLLFADVKLLLKKYDMNCPVNLVLPSNRNCGFSYMYFFRVTNG